MESDDVSERPGLSIRETRTSERTHASFSFSSTCRIEEDPASMEGSWTSNRARQAEFRRFRSKPELSVFERVWLCVLWETWRQKLCCAHLPVLAAHNRYSIQCHKCNALRLELGDKNGTWEVKGEHINTENSSPIGKFASRYWGSCSCLSWGQRQRCLLFFIYCWLERTGGRREKSGHNLKMLTNGHCWLLWNKCSIQGIPYDLSGRHRYIGYAGNISTFL